jgi:hypothetical protein
MMKSSSPTDWTKADAIRGTHWVDRLAEAFLGWLYAPLVKQAAGEVARDCRAAIAAHAMPSIRGVNVQQARGYLRALSPGFVLREIDAVLSRRRIGRALRPCVFAEALEQVIQLVLADKACLAPATAVVRLSKAA